MKEWLRFHADILLEAIKSFWRAMRTVRGMIGAVTLLVLLINDLGGYDIPGLDKISSYWLLALLGVVCLYFFLDSIYKKYRGLEQRKNKEIAELHNTIDSVRDIKSRLFQFIDGVYSEGWQLEVKNYLRATGPQKYVKGFERALSDREPERSAKAYLKGVADCFSGAMIRQARLSED